MLSTRIKGRTRIYSGWTTLDRVTMELPDGAVVDRHIENHGSAVCVLPYDPVRRVALLVSMPRAPVVDRGEPDLLEVIAGRVETNEDPAECATREALEEAGVRLRSVEPLMALWSMPSLSTEHIEFFLASYAVEDRVAAGGGVEGEDECITVHERPLDKLWTEIATGQVNDMKTVLILTMLRIRSPDLFTPAAPSNQLHRLVTGAG